MFLEFVILPQSHSINKIKYESDLKVELAKKKVL